MHYNLKTEIERIRGEYVIQVEVSSVGRCRRQRIVSKTFEGALSDLRIAHDQMLSEVQAFEDASKPAAAPASEPAVTALAEVAAAKAKNAKDLSGVSDLMKGQSKRSAKAAPRKFASA